jgi:intergrase/recombinase
MYVIYSREIADPNDSRPPELQYADAEITHWNTFADKDAAIAWVIKNGKCITDYLNNHVFDNETIHGRKTTTAFVMLIKYCDNAEIITPDTVDEIYGQQRVTVKDDCTFFNNNDMTFAFSKSAYDAILEEYRTFICCIDEDRVDNSAHYIHLCM